jgi:hypothetical protein
MLAPTRANHENLHSPHYATLITYPQQAAGLRSNGEFF